MTTTTHNVLHVAVLSADSGCKAYIVEMQQSLHKLLAYGSRTDSHMLAELISFLCPYENRVADA